MKRHLLLACFMITALCAFSQPGTLDESFGKKGIVITKPEPHDYPYNYCFTSALQSDGKIVAAGTGGYNGVSGFLLLRYNTDGSIDSSFGVNGRAVAMDTVEGFWQIYTEIILAQDKILLCGITYIPQRIVLIRYNADGSLDSTFGTNGITKTTLNPGHKTDVTDPHMGLQSDGKIVVTGNYSTGINDNKRGYLVRYSSDGILDEGFGEKGVIVIAFDNLIKINAI